MKQFWKRWGLLILLLAGLPVTYILTQSGLSNTEQMLRQIGINITLPHSGLLNPYFELVLIYIGINIILTVSLNLVNGYMGEFSVGHAGFMAIGAYTAAYLSGDVLPWNAVPYLFPLTLIAGGIAAGLVGMVLAVPSFRTRGDYLAIVTLAFNMIIKSVLENLGVFGGSQGYVRMPMLTTLTWVYAWVIVLLIVARNFVYSKFGRGVLSIREDETAAGLVGVNTRQVKVLTFIISAFIAGIAGGLFAHAVYFINPGSFTILKSTDMLVMVYLGGVGSLGGSILGATIYTVLLEALREVLPMLGISAEWRMAAAPLFLVFLMIFRPRGIMGGREFSIFRPRQAKEVE